MRAVLTIAVTCLIGPFVASAGEHSTSPSDAILNAYIGWVETTNAKDVVQWSTFLAPGAVFFPPGVPALVSREAIVDYYIELFEDPHFTLDCTQTFVEVADSNDLAWSRGTCNATFSLPDGNIGRGSSKWAKIWVRSENGKWKCQLNTWNMNQ